MTSDFSTLTPEQIKRLANNVIEQNFLGGKTVDEAINAAPATVRPMVKAKFDETLNIYATELEKQIKENKTQNPNLNQQQLAAEVEKDLEASLLKNQKFTSLVKEANALGIKIDINVIGNKTKETLASYDGKEITKSPTGTASDLSGTQARDAQKYRPDGSRILERYSKEDALAVRNSVENKVPFIFNQAAMDDLLDNTMVQNKRGRSDTKMDGPLGEMFKGLEPMFQRIMELLMAAFGGISGQGNAGDYGVMNSTSAAMSRVLQDIQGSGPGEGVWKNYNSNPLTNGESFTDADLIKISSINGNIRDAKTKDDKKHWQEQAKLLSEENQQRFGLDSKQMWQVFEADKRTLMEQTVQSMAVEARNNGLKDTSTDINRLMASFYSKGASEREKIDFEIRATVDAMNRGIIPRGDPRKITEEDKKRIEQEFGGNIFGSIDGVSRTQVASNSDIPLPNPPSTNSSTNVDVPLSTNPLPTNQFPTSQGQTTQMTQAQSHNPLDKLVGGISLAGLAGVTMGDNNTRTPTSGINPIKIAKDGCYGVNSL
jgi:hypothetical protein